MLESNRAAILLSEWKQLEDRITQIKAELGGILRVSSAEDSAEGAVNVDPSDIDDSNEAKRNSPVAPGTKSRATLEAVKALGGRARAGDVKKYLVSAGTTEDSPNVVNLVRSYFNYLRRKGYLTVVPKKRGLWTLTPKAVTALTGGT